MDHRRRPKAILEGAIAWLRGRSALLPGIATLERLVAEGRHAADVRVWAALAGPLDPVPAEKLIALGSNEIRSCRMPGLGPRFRSR